MLKSHDEDSCFLLVTGSSVTHSFGLNFVTSESRSALTALPLLLDFLAPLFVCGYGTSQGQFYSVHYHDNN